MCQSSRKRGQWIPASKTSGKGGKKSKESNGFNENVAVSTLQYYRQFGHAMGGEEETEVSYLPFGPVSPPRVRGERGWARQFEGGASELTPQHYLVLKKGKTLPFYR